MSKILILAGPECHELVRFIAEMDENDKKRLLLKARQFGQTERTAKLLMEEIKKELPRPIEKGRQIKNPFISNNHQPWKKRH